MSREAVEEHQGSLLLLLLSLLLAEENYTMVFITRSDIIYCSTRVLPEPWERDLVHAWIYPQSALEQLLAGARRYESIKKIFYGRILAMVQCMSSHRLSIIPVPW